MKVITPQLDELEAKEAAKEEKKSKQRDESNKLEKLEEYLNTHYQFRYNTIKCQPEILRENGTYEQVTKYLVNSIKREINTMIGLTVSTASIQELLISDFAEPINPIVEYFNDLPPWDGTDYIQALSNTVTVYNKDNWYTYLKKWLTACVANSTTLYLCQNHTCLVLTGSQGKYKTTWLDNLTPKDLSRYLYTGKIDPENKDSLTLIAEFFMINIDDQLKQLNKKDENALKNLITTPNVKYRRAYDIFIQEYPHIANFCASVNGNEFLTDPTGSRRFLPFEVLNIDIEAAKALNINGIWTQAKHLFKEGFRYYFTPEEVDTLNNENEMFSVQSAEESLLTTFFEPCTRQAANVQHLPTALILSRLQAKTSNLRLSEKKLGEALTKHKFERWQKGSAKLWVWSCIEKDFNTALDELTDKPKTTPF